MKIVTVEQMQRLEESSASEGVSTDTLMENAGLAVAKVASREMGLAAGRRILVLVGPGNNGGDGLVAARHLQRWSAEVTAYVLIPRRDEDPKLKLALEYGVQVLSAKDDSVDALLARSDLVIDAVLGTGKARPLEGIIKEAMKQLRASRERSNTKILALDLPTGLNADTGETDPACLDADVTVALGYPKTGHFRFPGAAKLGRLEVVDIGIPRHVGENIRLEMLTSDWVRGKLPQRPPSAHKGTFGHALVVAGSRNYVGAASLTAQAAARVGPGLVTLASPESIYPFLATKLTEIIHMPLPDDRPEDRKDGNVTIHPDAAGIIKKGIRHYDSMVVGCGLGNSEGLIEFMRKLLMAGPQPEIPVLIDANGLNNMSAIKDWWRRLKSPVVVTPHPGEMSTLTGVPTSSIEAARWETATEWSAKWGHVVVLKGAHTVVSSPDGACRVSPFANPALASGGTGDVLAGITGGLLAQGLSPEDAAGCAVYLHGAAGELVRDKMGDTGTLAGDLIPALPRVIKTIRQV